jgi:hypothetical protein
MRSNWLELRLSQGTYEFNSAFKSIQIQTVKLTFTFIYSTLIRTQNEFFTHLTQKIIPYAQIQLANQWALLQSEEERIGHGNISPICTRTYYRSMGIPCWHMIKSRLAEGETGRIQPLDFHSHWHWVKPLPGSAPVELPRPILDPETRQRRRTQEADRRAQNRAHHRVRQAQTGRILSQHEQIQTILRHCSACTIYGHDKTTCRGCRSTNHRRTACPFVPYQGRGSGTQLHQPPLPNRAIQVPQNDVGGSQNTVRVPQIASFLPTPSQSRPDTPSAFGGIQMSQNQTQNGPFRMPEDDWVPQTQYAGTQGWPAGSQIWPGSQGRWI